ncbi:alpha/beta-type small acid-soluble spore protein [uncultured Clostridium sp.]|uniref:alpha/beta-type small acid-soluble spore protein n=1 Tax=uncultured Clostridium sp. TaxID=59620 RepID=UPI0025FCD812|nr:alpha/beta-type small acid-soluble spore protein [uncultured Clostridium sp.]
MASNNSNRHLVPEAKEGLNRFKTEVASEMGLQDYANGYKGDLTSKQNGSVGGEMVKRMVESYERGMQS